MTRAHWIEVARIVAVTLVIALYHLQLVPLQVLLVAVAFGLYPLVRTGVLDLVRERKIGTEIFITIATLIAIVGGEYLAGAMVMDIILVAELIADLNTERARASIRTLIVSAPQQALVRRGGVEVRAQVADLRKGDIVIVRAGEQVPVDGAVKGGQGAVNEAPITGESIPQEKGLGARVFASSVLESGALDVETERVGGDTMVARIVAMVENAEHLQAPVQRLADRLAAWLIPVVLVFLVVVYAVTRDLQMIITLLIFASPAELGLATPLVIIAAVARAARAGILVKGGLQLELLAKVDAIAFDKTGTLTLGRPGVLRVEVTDAELGETKLLRIAAAAERRSSHPLAKAIVDYVKERGLDFPEPSEFEVLPGRGVKAQFEGTTVLAGNAAFLSEAGVPMAPRDDAATTVCIARDGRLVGVIHLGDVTRTHAREAIARLKREGIRRTIMLTGDQPGVARRVADELGIDQVEAGLLPDQKVEVVRRLQAEGYKVAMVGDGINDAPALAAAEVGIAMGAAGTQAAIEAADIALMTDDIAKIAEARALARRAYRTIKENLFIGVGVVHVLGITAALLKIIGPVEAAVLHLGPDLLVFLNSVKLTRVRLDEGS